VGRWRTILAAEIGAISMLIAGAVQAQLVLDGSLGPQGEIVPVANEFHVTDDHGVFSAGGENRFHSFSQFDIEDPSQTALFSSLRTPARVIVRVTQPGPFGAGSSLINGTLRSTISGADLYFLNPFGVFFGPSASIDVNGSFHASSADVLRFPEEDNAADLPTGSLSVPDILSAAEPIAFGFTQESPARVSITGSDSLAVPAGETLSFIGGEFRLQSFGATNVRAPGATVQIAAVAGPADIPLDLETLDPAALPDAPAMCPGAGCITLANGGAIDVSSFGGGFPAGQIVIRGGRFLMLSGSSLTAVERDAPPGATGQIDVAVNGSIEIAEGSLVLSASESLAQAGDLRLAGPLVAIDGGRVASEARGEGDGGAIEIDAETLRISNASERFEGSFVSSVAGEGNGGDLTVRATNVELIAGGQLRADTEGSGDAGRLQVLEADLVHLNGVDAQERPSSITGRASEIATGRGGDLTLETRILQVENGAQISAATFGAGSAGDLRIAASEIVMIRGGDEGFTLVSAASRKLEMSPPLGQSGNLTIAAPSVLLADGGQVSVSTDGTLDAGHLEIFAGDVSISGVDPLVGNASGVFAQSNSPDLDAGAGGDIAIAATGDIRIAKGGRVSVLTKGGGPGSGGSISLVAHRGVTVIDGGQISAQSLTSGDAGNITIDAGPRLELVRASITTEAKNASGGQIDITARDFVVLQDARITTSVQDGTGGGGDVTIDPQFVILDRSEIVANAFAGPGGNIRITAGTFLASPDSVIDASSQLGIDGNVVIASPNPELTGKLAALPQGFLNASELMADACLARTATEGSFVVRPRGMLPPPDAALSLESGESPACEPGEGTL